MRYVDFELEISGSTTPGMFRARLVGNNVVEAAETEWELPPGVGSLPTLRLALRRGLRDARPLTLGDAAGSVTFEAFGAALFDKLLSGPIRDRFVQVKERAKEDGVRVRLRVSSPELAALPWEFLFDKIHGDFMCLSGRTPLVRVSSVPRRVGALQVKPPLRVLVMGSNPDMHGAERLNLDAERASLETSLKVLVAKGLVHLQWVEGSSRDDLQRALLQRPWHMFHFAGHGQAEEGDKPGGIVLCNAQGKPALLDARSLGRLLGDAGVRIAVLNCCEGARGDVEDPHDALRSTASVLSAAGVPAVVAMQYAISDLAANEFAKWFYSALVQGDPVEMAMAAARKAIASEASDSREWATPVLFLNAEDGQLFAVEGTKHDKPPWHKRPEVLLQGVLPALGALVLIVGYMLWARYGRENPSPPSDAGLDVVSAVVQTRDAGSVERLDAVNMDRSEVRGIEAAVVLPLDAGTQDRPQPRVDVGIDVPRPAPRVELMWSFVRSLNPQGTSVLLDQYTNRMMTSSRHLGVTGGTCQSQAPGSGFVLSLRCRGLRVGTVMEYKVAWRSPTLLVSEWLYDGGSSPGGAAGTPRRIQRFALPADAVVTARLVLRLPPPDNLVIQRDLRPVPLRPVLPR